MPSSKLFDIVTLARRWTIWVVLAAIVGGVTSFLVAQSMTPVYRASARLLVTQAGNAQYVDTYNQVIGAERLARTYADLIKTHTVLDTVVENVGGTSYEALAGSIEVLPIRDTQVLQLSVEHTDPALARDLANAIGERFIEFNTSMQQERFQGPRETLEGQLQRSSDEIRRLNAALDEARSRPSDTPAAREAKDLAISRLQREIAEAQYQYGTFVRTFEDLRLAESRSASNVALVDRALLPGAPIRPRIPIHTALGAAAAVALMVTLLVLRERLDDTVTSPDRLATWTGLYPLAVVGRFKSRDKVFSIGTASGANDEQGLREAEPYRVLRTNVQFSEVDTPLRTILVTSATPGEGKTTTAANLALALALAGRRTILIDADLRRPSVHRVLGLKLAPGLTTALRERKPVEQYLQETPIPTLSVLTAGPIPPNPSEILGSARMRTCLEGLKALETIDYIVIDTAPVLLTSDPLALASFVDGVVLIVDSRTTRRRSIVRAQQALSKVGANLLGAVLNRYAQKNDPYYYANYEYASTERDDQATTTPAAPVSETVVDDPAPSRTL